MFDNYIQKDWLIVVPEDITTLVILYKSDSYISSNMLITLLGKLLAFPVSEGQKFLSTGHRKLSRDM